MHICPKLITAAVGKNIDISFTVKLLEIARKLKMKKFGLNTYNDPDLIKEFKKFSFSPIGSIFSIKQEIKRYGFKEPVSSVLVDEFKETGIENNYNNFYGGNCGNGFQHELPYRFGLTDIDYVTGIYTLSEDKQTYDFKAVVKGN